MGEPGGNPHGHGGEHMKLFSKSVQIEEYFKVLTGMHICNQLLLFEWFSLTMKDLNETRIQV